MFRKPKFKAGDSLYFPQGDAVVHNFVVGLIDCFNNGRINYISVDGNILCDEEEVFATFEEAEKHLKQY